MEGGSNEGQRRPRGLRTEERLVEAARRVFERVGYLDARIGDITHEAAISPGSFYTYFQSKEEVFAAVIDGVQEHMLRPNLRGRLDLGDDVVALIDAANRDYLRTYQKNARLMALFEQVAQIDDDFQRLYRARTNAFVDRNAKLIRRLQREGRADAGIDPLVAAAALSSMVARMAYRAFVVGEEFSYETLVETLNRLWVNGLQLR